MGKLPAAVAVMVLASSLAAWEQPPIVVRGPTVVAFFSPMKEADLKANPDENETLSDFQFYNPQIREALQKDGIDFHEIYAFSFRVRIVAKVTTFHTGKVGVGYYFVAPSKKPHIEEGVLGDAPIEIAHRYFGTATK